ncbi:DUF427 domain-containing protein [Aliihoeflea sp. 40Bstr573]|uniref:DUF427 domain-containing protein n=1 Tax=Aliihoeflea sp. 40Bstr573 TaxID=2696467 RepID=UPI002095311A|nr:DUF427 domain-containing protein [Aliihoeflea sp. 40Bstr573]MCO6386071.1 DUF427 domain-containing protein [Aliihoeflea sp. 40Bstr573]
MSNPSPGLKRDPDHTITIAPHPGSVTVKFGEVVIASTRNALELREATYPPVLYIPFADIYFEHLIASDTKTRCPFKGDAAYWSVSGQGEGEPDVMWTYAHPYDEVAAIKDHAAFYPNKVSIDAD